MAMGINEAVFKQGIKEAAQLAKTNAHKISAILDILEKNGLIDALEAGRIRQAKVY